LESGAGEFSFDWALTIPLIAETKQVCAWDRAGYAWSDMHPGFEQFPAVAADMRAVLQKAGVNPPWILVGHALGTLYARDYQRRYPQDVAGLLLIDPMPEEDVQVRMFGRTVSLIDMANHDLTAWPLRPYGPSRTSPPPRRLAPGESVPTPFDRLPGKWRAAHLWGLQRLFSELDGLSDPQALAVMESERTTFTDLYNARHAPPFDLPVIVLSRSTDTTPQIARMQEEIAHISRNSVRRIAPSGTQIQIEKPELVAQAVAQLAKLGSVAKATRKAGQS